MLIKQSLKLKKIEQKADMQKRKAKQKGKITAMGMSASQARFLGLTARKNNVEFEGQQINQQRTTLSNESANYYNDLLGMTVPTPPSADNYTKTVYTFEDGALTNTITALIPLRGANGNTKYTVSYLKEYTDDFSLVSASSSIVTKKVGTDGNAYYIGSKELRKLGDISTTTTVGSTYTYKGKSYTVKNDGTNYYIDAAAKVANDTQCTATDMANVEYYYDENPDDDTLVQYYKGADGKFYTDAACTQVSDKTEDQLIMTLYDASQYDGTDESEQYTVNIVTKNADGSGYTRHGYKDGTEPHVLSAAELATITTTSLNSTDEYLQTLNDDGLENLKAEEADYLALLKDTYGKDTQWYVRYLKDSTTGAWKPNFYNAADLTGANVVWSENNNSQSTINCYTIGSKVKTEEVKDVQGVQLEQDTTGRYINITIPQRDGNGNLTGSTITYALTTNTSTDEEAYNDAMNQYEYDKYKYDQTIQNINSKIEIVQQQDKNLELRLKQLDTEQNAISTELDAVKKVIEKNVESSFKTFG